MHDNETRANRASQIINHYATLVDDTSDEYWLDEHVADLLADLMHLCKRADVDFSQQLALAEIHFEEEGA